MLYSVVFSLWEKWKIGLSTIRSLFPLLIFCPKNQFQPNIDLISDEGLKDSVVNLIMEAGGSFKLAK